MRIDAYTHFFPKRFFDKLDDVAADYTDMGKRVRSLPALYDLDVRKRIVDGHKDYQQILSYSQPPIELIAKTPGQIDELCRLINDGLAEIVAKDKDHFPGFVAQVSLAASDAGVGEAQRAVNELGALGVQIYTNVAGKPLDRPEYRPFFAKMSALGIPIWLHPVRGAEVPDYISEQKSLYEIWWTFGWSYETATAMIRLGLLENHGRPSRPENHHPPFRRHRADAGRPHRARQRRHGIAHLRHRLCELAQEPEEARARLLQTGFLGGHRRLHRGACDQGRPGILPAR
jgi:Amidohydrolase